MLIAPDSRWYGWLFYVVLGAYSIGGAAVGGNFFTLRRWVGPGGNVTLAGWRSGEPAAAEQTATRRRRPLAALLRKELQLNRGGLMGMGAFFVLHVCAMMLRNKEWATETSSVQETLEFVGGLWLLVPLFLVGPGVAEERRLGTLDVQAGQPVSSRLQFTIKLLFSLLVGGLLSAWLLWLAEGIGVVRGVPSGLGEIPLFSGRQLFDAISLVELSGPSWAFRWQGFWLRPWHGGPFRRWRRRRAVVIVVLLLAWAVLSGGWQAWATGTMLPVMFWPSVGVALMVCVEELSFCGVGLALLAAKCARAGRGAGFRSRVGSRNPLPALGVPDTVGDCARAGAVARGGWCEIETRRSGCLRGVYAGSAGWQGAGGLFLVEIQVSRFNLYFAADYYRKKVGRRTWKPVHQRFELGGRGGHPPRRGRDSDRWHALGFRKPDVGNGLAE